MTETTENQTTEPTPFATASHGLTTLKKDGAVFDVTPDGNVTAYDAGKGVHVEAARKSAASTRKPQPLSDISEDERTGQAYDTTVRVPENGAALVVTRGIVTLVRKNAAETAAETGAKEKTGIELKIGADGATGTIGGTAFDIDTSSNDVAVDADRVQVAPAAKASADKRATKISLSADFNKAALRSAGARVNITLDENGVPEVVTNGTVRAVDASSAEAKGAEIKINGNITRLTLNGHVFDINTANGEVIAYGPGDNGAKLGNKSAAVVPADMKDYQVIIGQDGNSIALNNAGIVKSADGALAVATAGAGRLKAAVAAESNDANEGWVLAGDSPEEGMLLYIKPIGVRDFKEAEKAAEAQRNAGVTDAHVMSKSEAKAVTNKKDNKDAATTERISAVFAKACEGIAHRVWTRNRWGLGGQRTTLGLAKHDEVFSNGYEKHKYGTVIARNVPRSSQLVK